MNDGKQKNQVPKTGIFSSLYWQVSAIFLAVLIIFSAFAIYISVSAARNYSEEVNQKLNRALAGNMLGMISPLTGPDSINQEGDYRENDCFRHDYWHGLG